MTRSDFIRTVAGLHSDNGDNNHIIVSHLHPAVDRLAATVGRHACRRRAALARRSAEARWQCVHIEIEVAAAIPD